MHETTISSTVIITVAAVLFFVFILVLLLVVIDHKARIPGKLRRDLFHITGSRQNHPLWSYIVGGFLLTVISGIGLQLGASILKKTHVLDDVGETSNLLVQLKEDRDVEKARHFHNSTTSMALEGEKTVCFYCHGDFPHFEKPMIRTLLNMHTQFLGCMTCHADPEIVDENKLALKWLNFSGIEVTGPYFGTAYDGDSGFLAPTDDLYSKIVAYSQKDGVERLLEITEKDPAAIDFVSIQEQLTGQDRDLVKKSFHKIVMAKGRFCTKCHTDEDKSFMPFRELGFSSRRTGELTNLNIIGLVQKYKKFYMPELGGRSSAVIESLMGPEIDVPVMEKDPADKRSWWRADIDPTDADN